MRSKSKIGLIANLLRLGLSPSHLGRFFRHLPNFAKLYWRLFQDSRTPLRAKAIIVVAALYFASPFDLIPNLIYPFLGTLDDLAIAWAALRWFIYLCPPDVVQEHIKQIDTENRVKEAV
jgi:uncharacterized membrane protein YkvA (DUF1232 family)